VALSLAVSACGDSSAVQSADVHPCTDLSADAPGPNAHDAAVTDAATNDLAPAVDASGEVGSDATVDAAIDASSETGSDAPGDAPLDASVDAPGDAPLDAAVDAPGDTPLDADAPGPDATPVDAPTTVCPRGYTDCDGDPSNGCEVVLADDPTHCGACDRVCPGGTICEAGGCVAGPALAVALAIDHGCATLADRTVGCWGSNNLHQLGDGTTDNHLSTVRVVGLRDVTALAAIDGATCALRTNGTVACWGDNTQERLGVATVATVDAPADVPGIADAQQITLGPEHACALRAGGRVSCWGRNRQGESGAGVTRVRDLLTSGALQVVAGLNVTCIRHESGTVRCVGANTSGAFGSATPAGSATFVTVPGVTAPHTLAVSDQTFCASVSGGRVLCWGLNDDAGNGGPGGVVAPTTVLGVFEATHVVGGSNLFCALSGGRSIYCWGGTARDITGDTFYPSGVPLLVPDAPPSAGFAVAQGTLIVRRRDGALQAISTRYTISGGNSNLPTRVPLFGHPWDLRCPTGACGSLDVQGSRANTCALRDDGRVACWGTLPFVEAGETRAVASRRAPAVVAGLTEVTQITTGTAHACALRRDGRVWCWGANSYGQLGDGREIPRYQPAAVDALRDAVDVAASEQHTCAVTSDGRVWCWGDNAYGELGDGTTTRRALPTAVPGVTDAVDVSVGVNFSCALRRTGTVACWGLTTRLGVGTVATTGTLAVTAVPGVTDAVAIDAGNVGTCARRRDGTAVCWGGGSGTIPNRAAPLAGLADVAEVRVGSDMACAVRARGEVRCWGNNPEGQLGDGTTTTAPYGAPVTVVGLTDATHINPSGGATCARRRNGQVVCWGRGGLGDGSDLSTIARTRPGAPIFGLP
jgi:alpha-tubulin suppressor-like RCC1 family protein